MQSKVVIITGASKGIGLEVAKQLIAASHKVVLVARSQEVLEQLKTAHPDQVDYIVGDMTDYSVSVNVQINASPRRRVVECSAR